MYILTNGYRSQDGGYQSSPSAGSSLYLNWGGSNLLWGITPLTWGP